LAVEERQTDSVEAPVVSDSFDENQEHDIWRDQPTLEELTRQDIWSLRRAFLERLWPEVRGLRVLDVGSGPAHDSLSFAERGAKVSAVDFSEIALKLARKFYGELGLGVETVRADAMAMPFEDGAFDVAFNAGVLEHFDDAELEKVLSEMIRVVRPGGWVLAFCPNRYNIFYQHLLRKIHEHRYEFERAFSASEMKAWFETRGLSEVRVSGVHVHPAFNYVLPGWLLKHHRIEPWMRTCFGPMERWWGLHKFKSLIGQDFVVWGQVRGGGR
jgi:ubiquinone/menaquinone biosynthesis C-methylase UbiE